MEEIQTWHLIWFVLAVIWGLGWSVILLRIVRRPKPRMGDVLLGLVAAVVSFVVWPFVLLDEKALPPRC